MIQIEKVPNQVVLAGQTVPFIVTTDLFDTDDNFDPVERSFKYVFEVKTLDDLGNYVTYSTVAIPPRPDSLVGFFDAGPLISSAITFDNGTHLNEDGSPCPRSIVRFKVIVTERYLDNNTYYMELGYGDWSYVNGQTVELGEYVAIDGAVSEGLDPYLITYTGDTKSPLHHHQLLDKQFIIRPNEPLTVSFIAKPLISENILQYIHGDYGSFDFGDINTYSGITAGLAVISKTSIATKSGAALKARIPNNLFTNEDVEGELFFINNLKLQPNKTYEFVIYARLIGSSFNLPTNTARYDITLTGSGFSGTILTQYPTVRSSATRYVEIKIKFTTGPTIVGNEEIGLGLFSTTSNNLIRLNGRSIHYDSANLFEIDDTSNMPDSARVVVDRGLSTEITYGLSTMMDNINDFDTLSKFRFDINAGVNKIFDGPDQDTTTGFYIGANLLPGKYYEIELFNSLNPLPVIAKTEKIYQVNCGNERYNKVRLKWLNQLGAWDYYTFDKVSVASKTIEKETYKVTAGRITQSNGVYDYIEDNASMGYKVLNISENDFIIINSDWIAGETGKFIKDIINSKQVYILNPEAYMDVPDNSDKEYPVIVENADFEYRNNSSNAKLTNATFTLRLAAPFNNKTTNI